MFRNGYILSRREDMVWFVALPFFAFAAAHGCKIWLPAVAVASVTLWITVPHQFATWIRAYGFRDEFSQWKDRLLVGPIVIFGMSLLGLKYAPLTTFLLVTLWDHQHSLMQQYGFSRIYDFKGRSGAPSTGRFDLLLNWVLFVHLILTAPLFTELWVREAYNWGMEIGKSGVATVHAASWMMVAVYGIIYVYHVVNSLRSGYPVNPQKYIFLLSSYFLWYSLAWQTHSFLVYAIGSKLMHGIQYIVIVFWYIRRKAERTQVRTGLLASVTRPGNVKGFILLSLCYAAIFNMVVGRGLEEFGFGVLNFTLPYDNIAELGLRSMTYVAGFDLYSAALIQSMGLVHYYFDSFIWKVRDVNIQKGL